MTDACQPLDCRVFGALKARARAKMSKIFALHVFSCFDPRNCSFPQTIPPVPMMDHTSAMSMLEEIWNDLNEYTIEASWDQALLGWDEVDIEEEEEDFEEV